MTDNSDVMESVALPAVFDLLRRNESLAVDAALVEALPELGSGPQLAALELLVGRAESAALTTLVSRFRQYDQPLKTLLVSRAAQLSSGLRGAIASTSRADRACAITMIVKGRCHGDAYLLADALRVECDRTRHMAAEGLHRLTEDLVNRREAAIESGEVTKWNARADQLAEAVRVAMRRSTTDDQGKILQAALWLVDRLEAAIVERVCDTHSTATRRVEGLLETTRDPRMAGFAVRALAVPQLQAQAGRSISHCRDANYLSALFRESWLLNDPRIAQGCRWIRDGKWLELVVNVLASLEPAAVASAVRMLTLAGLTPDRKQALVQELLGCGLEEVRRAVVERLVHDQSDTAVNWLSLVAIRSGDTVAKMASNELRRRRMQSGLPRAAVAPGKDAVALFRQAVERYWSSFDELSDDERTAMGEAIRASVPALGPWLRAKLASTDLLDQARTLRVASSLGLLQELEDPIRQMTHATNPIARSVAVSLLPEIPGPVSLRLLRTKVDDPDSRVQANAIEALDLLDLDDRVDVTMSKLKSKNGRVRAAAVKSLLRADVPEAGEALLDMLDDSAPSQRLGAVWIIEELRLQSLRERVGQLMKEDLDVRVRQRATRVWEMLADGKIHSAAVDSICPVRGEPATVGVMG